MAVNTSVSLSKAKDLCCQYIRAGIVPFLRGSPGTGKSAIMKEIAKDFNLHFIDLRLSQIDPSDLNGFAVPNHVTGKVVYMPVGAFPLTTDPLPLNDAGVHCNGWLLFLDEFNSASPAVQKASYKLTLDRMVGEHQLHKKCAVVCAGNLETDNAITSKLSTAMQSRLAHINLTKDTSVDWLKWANSNGIDFRITSFINYKPEILNAFKPDHAEYTFPCQRTWEFVSKLVASEPDLNSVDHFALIAGVIGEGAAHEFIAFTQVFNQLPTIQDILNNPIGCKIPTDISSVYGVCGLLANHASDTNIGALLTYTNRLPAEFTFLTMKDMIRRQPSLIRHEEMGDFISKNRDDFL